MGDEDDGVLVARAVDGDRRALELLLDRHADRVHAVCRRIVAHPEDALDATQEAMIAIARGITRFDGRAAFSTWCYRIATNAALDELRKRSRRPQLHVVGDDDRAPADFADDLAQRRVEGVVDRISIDAALADLPEEFRVPVVMRDVGDLDYAEIAEALSIPIGTVKSRIARGRRMLLERLGNRDPGDERPTREESTGTDGVPPPDDQPAPPNDA